MTPLRKKMIEDMTLAGLSANTRRLYSEAVYGLAKHYLHSPDQLSEEEVRAYLLYVKDEKRFAEGTLRICYYGIKFFLLKHSRAAMAFPHHAPHAQKQLPADHPQSKGSQKPAGPCQDPKTSGMPDSHIRLRTQNIRGDQA